MKKRYFKFGVKSEYAEPQPQEGIWLLGPNVKAPAMRLKSIAQ
jgi:hypothetical protein